MDTAVIILEAKYADAIYYRLMTLNGVIEDGQLREYSFAHQMSIRVTSGMERKNYLDKISGLNRQKGLKVVGTLGNIEDTLTSKRILEAIERIAQKPVIETDDFLNAINFERGLFELLKISA